MTTFFNIGKDVFRTTAQHRDFDAGRILGSSGCLDAFFPVNAFSERLCSCNQHGGPLVFSSFESRLSFPGSDKRYHDFFPRIRYNRLRKERYRRILAIFSHEGCPQMRAKDYDYFMSGEKSRELTRFVGFYGTKRSPVSPDNNRNIFDTQDEAAMNMYPTPTPRMIPAARSSLERHLTSLIHTAFCLSFATLVALGTVFAPAKTAWGAEPRVQGAPALDVSLGVDHIVFLGSLTEEQADEVRKTEDRCLIRLNRRLLAGPGRSPRDYYMLAKRIDPLEGKMLADAFDGEWNTCDQFHAALVAGAGHNPQVVARYEARLDTIVKEIEKTFEKSRQANEEGAVYLTKTIFHYLHENVFTAQYDINCTDPAEVLETGRYNCVSATLLFNAVAERFGLDVCGLEMPGHALSRVKYPVDGGIASMDLETTAPNWFALKDSAARRAATLEKIASPAAVDGSLNTSMRTPTASARPADTVEEVGHLSDISRKLREITPVQLIATIYYNQGVDFLKDKNYPEAAAANIKALYLDPESDTAWGNLMATINNWAIHYAEASRFDLASQLLDHGVALDETYEKFRINQHHIFCHWVNLLAKEGRYDDAMIVYRHAAERLPNDQDLKAIVEAFPTTAAR